MARRRLPRPCWHKANQRWYVTLDGQEVYLSGKLARARTPPPAVQQEYDRVMAAWLAARALPPDRLPASPSIAEVWLSYLAYCRQKYSDGHVRSITAACKVLAQMFGVEPIGAFTAAKLEQVQTRFLELGWFAGHVNSQIGRVRKLFAWASLKGLCRQEVWLGLRALPGLKVRPRERRQRQVQEAPDELIEQTLPRLPERVQVMVRAHRLIGCRAQEIVCMRTCDLDLDADPDDVPDDQKCWRYTPSESKTDEEYWLGPKVQEILRPLLNPAEPAAWLFPTRRQSRGRGCYSTKSYRTLIQRACQQEPPLPSWTVLQLRHTAAEEARRKHPAGLEASQARLRHSKLSTSERYAHELNQLGRDVARQLG